MKMVKLYTCRSGRNLAVEHKANFGAWEEEAASANEYAFECEESAIVSVQPEPDGYYVSYEINPLLGAVKFI